MYMCRCTYTCVIFTANLYKKYSEKESPKQEGRNGADPLPVQHPVHAAVALPALVRIWAGGVVVPHRAPSKARQAADRVGGPGHPAQVAGVPNASATLAGRSKPSRAPTLGSMFWDLGWGFKTLRLRVLCGEGG